MSKSTERSPGGKQQFNNNCNKASSDTPKHLVTMWVSSSPYGDCDGRGEVMALWLVTQNL